MRGRNAVLAVLLVGTVACGGRRAGDPLKPGFNVYSKDQDVQLGRQAAQQVAQQVDIVDNRQLQQYIDTVGQRLAKQTGAGGYPYEFTLINDPAINAFALPGGPIFVNSGLIAAAENEAQLAGVLAHEIAHVALRHATSQASKANLLQVPAALAAAMIGQGSVGAQLGQAGLGFGLNTLMLRYSRGAEEEADALGARIMAAAGYNPIEMARFFEKLEGEGGPRAPQFLSSHPNPGNRVKDVQAEIQTLPGGANYNRSGNNASFQQAKQMVARLPEPDQQIQRARAASASASFTPTGISGYQPLDTRRFSVSYPQGWSVYGDRTSEGVTMAPPQGLVQDRFGGSAVGYGVLAGYYDPSGRTSGLQQASSELLSQLRAMNPNLRVQTGFRNVIVDGSPGTIARLSGSSPFGGPEESVLLTVARPEGLFYMVFIAPDRHFEDVQSTFDQMIRTIRFH